MQRLWIFLLALGLSQGLSWEGRASAPSSPSPWFSIKKSPCNIRRGPGKDYPIVWLSKAAMPVVVMAESEDWRRLKDRDGILGWVHKNMLSKKESAFVIENLSALYKKPAPNSRILAYLKPELLVWVRGCQDQWCRVKIEQEDQGKFEGYVKQEVLWPHGVADLAAGP